MTCHAPPSVNRWCMSCNLDCTFYTPEGVKMPTAIVKWKLPEEDEEFRTSYDGYKYKNILSDLDEHLRVTVKHGDRSGMEKKVCAEIREYLRQLSIEYGVDL